MNQTCFISFYCCMGTFSSEFGKILQNIGLIFTFLAIRILFPMINVIDQTFLSIIFPLFSFISLGYAIFSWYKLKFKAHALEQSIALSKDRWHTVFPKTVVSIVLSLLISFVVQSFWFYGVTGFAFVILIYVFIFQITPIFTSIILKDAKNKFDSVDFFILSQVIIGIAYCYKFTKLH